MNIFQPILPVSVGLALDFFVEIQNIENVSDFLQFLPTLLTLQNKTEKVNVNLSGLKYHFLFCSAHASELFYSCHHYL